MTFHIEYEKRSCPKKLQNYFGNKVLHEFYHFCQEFDERQTNTFRVFVDQKIRKTSNLEDSVSFDFEQWIPEPLPDQPNWIYAGNCRIFGFTYA